VGASEVEAIADEVMRVWKSSTEEEEEEEGDEDEEISIDGQT